MPLTTLALRHFRNIQNEELNLHPEFNFIFGKNAQGKTNLIEAIVYLSQLKSFRTSNKTDLIQNGFDATKISATLTKDELNWELDVALSPSERKIQVNGKKPGRHKDYFEILPHILFEPRDIYLFRDSPSERRKFLDRALFLMTPEFLEVHNAYKKSLTQKNKVLKDNPNSEILDVWNEELAKYGSEIIWQRQLWFENILPFLTAEYQAISGTNERFQIDYQPNTIDGIDLNNRDEIYKALLNAFAENRDLEIIRRQSTVGPHRDDFIAKLNERHINSHGSQGENRSAIIALKMAQIKNFSDQYHKTPLFLLDDVASELDAGRCQYLFSYLRDEGAQVFLTTTENDHIHEEYQGRSQSFLVEEGNVRVLA